MEGNSLDGLDGLEGLGLEGGGASDDDIFPTFTDLTPFEVEYFVQDLEEFKLEQVGNSAWLTQHERIEKLNHTAHNQAKEGYDEYVVDQVNTLEKAPHLIFDLMLIELWKDKIWPLVKGKIAKFSSLRTYIPVYHEASVANLLEICMFHRTTSEEARDSLIDLVDYCVRKLRHLLSTPNDELVRQVTDAKEIAEWDSIRCLDEQFVECEFQVCMSVISIIRFITDHRVVMPLAVTTRLLDTHDILLLLVPLMEKAPWVRKNRNNGRIEKFEEHSWQRVEDDDAGRLPKLHTQVWLSIYNIVMDQECRSRYELSSFRRENLLRLRRYINEVVVDQLPPLTNLHRTLEEMSISGQFTGSGTGPAPTPFVVELVAEARETLLRCYDGRWQEVANQQLKEVLIKETPEEMKRLSHMINIPKEMFEEPPKQDFQPPHGDRSSNDENSSAQATAAWEAVLTLATVRSTASFFAAAGAADAPPDEVIVIAPVADQPLPREGERLRLELRRSRRSLLAGSTSAKQRVAADAAAVTKRTVEADGGYVLAVDAPGVEPTATRVLPLVSQKGARRTTRQLCDLLEKPGREELKAMYTEDVAEFSVLVAAEEGGVPAAHVAHILPGAA
eukprot:TRINITY_DN25100_c0_g2_i1.p1 TRINITY_DN25100_c0_g2~~TRINITY_DN25100_c0_g2_i1.p1  ORF type:complete len:616 (+),score=129.62 TRINITY_DN25100_c0_g2_i1:67-1914(+)